MSARMKAYLFINKVCKLKLYFLGQTKDTYLYACISMSCIYIYVLHLFMSISVLSISIFKYIAHEQYFPKSWRILHGHHCYPHSSRPVHIADLTPWLLVQLCLKFRQAVMPRGKAAHVQLLGMFKAWPGLQLSWGEMRQHYTPHLHSKVVMSIHHTVTQNEFWNKLPAKKKIPSARE